MRRMIALAVSFGLIMAAATVVTAASLSSDQVVVNKQAQEMRIQTLRDVIKGYRNNIMVKPATAKKP